MTDPTPPAPVGVLDLDHFLPYRLSVLTNRISQGLAELYAARFSLSITQWRVIAVLGRYPGLSATAVAERAAMDKVAVSRAVAHLLERGLLERQMHAADRRRSILRLSAQGGCVYAQIVPLALDYEREVLAALDAGERETLARLLDTLGRRFAGSAAISPRASISG